MPEMPFKFDTTETRLPVIMENIQLLLSELYEERIGGANLGDVFTVGPDDIRI